MAAPGPLEELATDGLIAMPGARLKEAADDARARAGQTGDGRYVVLEWIFLGMNEWWEEHGGVPTPIAQQIDALLTERLQAVLDAEQPRDGYSRARELASALSELQTGPSDWTARGYLNQPQTPD